MTASDPFQCPDHHQCDKDQRLSPLLIFWLPLPLRRDVTLRLPTVSFNVSRRYPESGDRHRQDKSVFRSTVNAGTGITEENSYPRVWATAACAAASLAIGIR